LKVRYTRRAAADLAAVLTYIDERSPQGGAKVKARLKAIIDLLAEHPRIGRLTGQRGIRRVVANPYPYLVFYRATATEIVIYGIRHAARHRS
jgi:toxin ParE1/3/4